jgi:DNA-binding transcriptional MocR family regulator
LNNPANFITPASRRQEIAQVAEKYGLTIIEDEILRPMLDEHPGFISNLLPERSILVLSASKAIAAGLRVGFVASPKRFRQRVVEGLNASSLGVSPLTTELLVNWLENGEADRVIARRKEDIAARQELTAKILDGFDMVGHPNSYHVWLKLPEHWTSMRFTMEAQQRGVAVTPGEAFAVDSKMPYEAVRLSVVVPPTIEILRTGLEKLAGLLRGDSDYGRATV